MLVRGDSDREQNFTPLLQTTQNLDRPSVEQEQVEIVLPKIPKGREALDLDELIKTLQGPLEVSHNLEQQSLTKNSTYRLGNSAN